MWKPVRGSSRLWHRPASLSTNTPNGSLGGYVQTDTQVYTIPQRTIAKRANNLVSKRANNPVSKRKVDTALQLVGRQSLVDAQEQGIMKATATEKKITTKLGWVQNKLENYTHYSLFTTEQVEDLDECFQSVRFAAPQETWRQIMNMWYFWGKTSDGDMEVAAQHINSYMKELVNMSTTGCYNLAKQEGGSTRYPQHMLKFTLRARSYEYEVAMRANEAVGDSAAVLALWNEMKSTRDAIPDPDTLPPPLLAVGPAREKEYVQRRMMGQRREELVPYASVDQHVLKAALARKDHALMDAHMKEIMTVRAVEPSAQSHAAYISSLQQREMHLAVIEHMRVSLLRLTPAANPNPHNVTQTRGKSLNTELPPWTTTPALRSSFPPNRELWLQLFKSVLALYPPTAEEVPDYNPEPFLAHRGIAPLPMETNDALRAHIYNWLRIHQIPIEENFFQAMVETAPNADILMCYVNDLHRAADAVRMKAKNEPWTAEEKRQQAIELEKNRQLIVDLNKRPKDASFRRTFGRYTEEAKKLGLSAELYKTVQERMVNFLADVYADEDAAQKIDSTTGAVVPYKSERLTALEIVEKEKKDIINQNANHPRALQLLDFMSTIRSSVMAFGVPANADSEAAYIRSLILLGRRNEDLPPLTLTTSTSVLPVQPAVYTPTGSGKKEDNMPLPNNGKPLYNFKDRVNYMHAHLMRRESQLLTALNEYELIADALRADAEGNFGDGVTGPKPLDPAIICEFIEAFSELGVDAAMLKGPFETQLIHTDPNSEPAAYQLDADAVVRLHNASARMAGEAVLTIRQMMRLLAQQVDQLSVTDTHHIPLLKNGKAHADTYVPLLRLLAAHGDYMQITTTIEGAHQNKGIVPSAEMLNLLALAFCNTPEKGRAAHAVGILDIMELTSNPANIIRKPIDDADVNRAIIHGTAEDLMRSSHEGPSPVYPDGETVSLLIRHYHALGKLAHVEELWRRLIYRPVSSWTTLSAVEEQHAIQRAIATDAQLDDTIDEDLANTLAEEGEDGYSDALNPRKNTALQTLAKGEELPRVPVPTLLPKGARRPLPKHVQLRLDAPATTAVVQSFIQLGFPMHALQLYIDARESMPDQPFPDPPVTQAMAAAVHNNYQIMTGKATAESLAKVEIPTCSKVNALTVRTEEVVRVPMPREVAAKKHLQNLNLPVVSNAYNEVDATIHNHAWLEADTLAALAVYAQRKAQKYVQMKGDNSHLPPQALEQAHQLNTIANEVLAKLSDYAIKHPYLPGDPATYVFYSQPSSYNNFVNHAGAVKFAKPSLLVPFVTSTEDLYAAVDALAITDIALEETLFKVRSAIIPAYGLKRWFGIYPAMINQLMALRSARHRRMMIHAEVEQLRNAIDANVKEQKKKRAEEYSKMQNERARLEEEKRMREETKANDAKWLNTFANFLRDRNALEQLFQQQPIAVPETNVLMPPELARVKETTQSKAELQRLLQEADANNDAEFDRAEAKFQLAVNNVSKESTAGDLMLAPADLSLAINASEQIISKLKAHQEETLKGTVPKPLPSPATVMLDLITDYKPAPALLKTTRPGGFHTSPYGPMAKDVSKVKLQLDYARATFSPGQQELVDRNKRFSGQSVDFKPNLTPKEMRAEADRVIAQTTGVNPNAKPEPFKVDKHGMPIADARASQPLSVDFLEKYVFNDDVAPNERKPDTSFVRFGAEYDTSDQQHPTAPYEKRPLRGPALFRSRSKNLEVQKQSVERQRAHLLGDFASVAEVQNKLGSPVFDGEEIPSAGPRKKTTNAAEHMLRQKASKPKEAWASAASPADYGNPSPSKVQKIKNRLEKRSTLFD